MKQHATCQEILLLINSTFLSSEWIEKNQSEKLEPLREKEKLIEACWNGLLHELLPEIFEPPTGIGKLYLWQIKETSFFLELELGQFGETRDKYLSIDPYCFLSIQYYN